MITLTFPRPFSDAADLESVMMSIQIATKTIADMLSRAGTFDLTFETDGSSPNATTVYESGIV